MQCKLNSPVSRWLLVAGLVAGAATADARTLFAVTATQETLIKPGMSEDDVRIAIGHPDHIGGNFYEPEWIWTYKVVDPKGREVAVFDVDFDLDGRVASVEEHRLADLNR